MAEDIKPEDSHCAAIGIPDYLHRLGRPVDPVFKENELLYRRTTLESPDGIHPSAAAFPMKNDSFNRQEYSRSPKDVLFNTKATSEHEHFRDHKIFEIPVKDIDEIILGEFPSGKGTCKVHFEVSHEPEDCMYPHTEVHCFKDEEPIAPLKPDSAKRAARDYLVRYSRIIQT